jgi:hypothetical protein
MTWSLTGGGQPEVASISGWLESACVATVICWWQTMAGFGTNFNQSTDRAYAMAETPIHLAAANGHDDSILFLASRGRLYLGLDLCSYTALLVVLIHRQRQFAISYRVERGSNSLRPLFHQNYVLSVAVRIGISVCVNVAKEQHLKSATESRHTLR